MGLFSSKDEKSETAETQVSQVKVVLPKQPALLIPRISEKSANGVKNNKYVFLVKKQVNKIEVKKAIEAEYKVKVVMVNVINTKGKQKQLGRFLGKTSDFKKAIVTLKQGDSIKGITEGV
jgi:large subunit ribosomal protein L23